MGQQQSTELRDDEFKTPPSRPSLCGTGASRKEFFQSIQSIRMPPGERDSADAADADLASRPGGEAERSSGSHDFWRGVTSILGSPEAAAGSDGRASISLSGRVDEQQGLVARAYALALAAS